MQCVLRRCHLTASPACNPKAGLPYFFLKLPAGGCGSVTLNLGSASNDTVAHSTPFAPTPRLIQNGISMLGSFHDIRRKGLTQHHHPNNFKPPLSNRPAICPAAHLPTPYSVRNEDVGVSRCRGINSPSPSVKSRRVCLEASPS